MILCCGEALIDMIPTPTVAGPDGFVPHSGGAVFNTAIALGRQGIQTGMLTGMSTDMFGDQLRTALGESHVDTASLVMSGRPTTLAFVKLTNGHATYNFLDENSAGRMLDFADIPQIPSDVTALFFGGISLACEPCADAYAALLERDHADKVVMMDPNIRPGFIQNEARYRARLNQMITRTDIIKVSDEDLDWILPGPQGLPEKVAVLQDLGPSIVILTRGSEGATGYLRGSTSVTAAAQKVDVIDTVGAGDTFNAGTLAKLSELGVLTKNAVHAMPLEALEKALQNGASTAAITVSRAGANPPWANEL